MTTLIIGASRGIGAELVRQTDGSNVVATVRSGEAPHGARTVHLDVTDGESVARAAASIDEPIDLLIHNAGINPREGQAFGSADAEAWAHMLDVNVLGPLRVAEAFHGHLKRGTTPRFAVLSSQLGSMSLGGGVGYPAYNASKAALNKMVQDLAAAWKPDRIAVFALHPGWVRTDMGGPNAAISAEESARGILDVVTSKGIEDTGTFWNWNGTPHAW